MIIMGPNGAGKSRLSTRLAGQALSRIPAVRNLAQISDIPFQPPKAALDQLSAQAQSQFQNIWTLASDAQFALSTILSNDAQASMAYAAAARAAGGASSPPPDTQLTILLRLWSKLMPGRELKFDEHQPLVTNSTQSNVQPYRAQFMSDGERVALYVAARVLLAPAGLLVVDEPEVHLHSLLARRLWSMLEAERSDCRFIYITHDISFALSRRDATYIVLRSENDYQVVTKKEEIPDDVFRDVVGAATLTISSAQTVFCEGTSGKDDVLYDAVLSRHGYQVVAAGSCANVEQCVEALSDEKIIRGSQPKGIVDRDFWPEERRTILAGKNVKTLEVHEVESLYVTKPLVLEVARHLGKTKGEEIYSSFLNRVRQQAEADAVRVAVERAKQRVFNTLARHIERVPVSGPVEARNGLIDAVSRRLDEVDAGTAFDEEWARVSDAINTDDAMFAIFPAKAHIGFIAKELGMTPDGYRQIAEHVIRIASQDSPLVQYMRRTIGV